MNKCTFASPCKVLSVFLLLLIIATAGCVSRRATIKTFIDPAIESSSVKSVALFQMRNTSFSPGESLEMDRLVTQAFLAKNPSVRILASSESNRLLNEMNLTQEYANFLRDFEYSGIPDTDFLRKLGEEGGLDAIIQGRLSEVQQEDRQRSAYGMVPSKTTVTVRYTLLSTDNGRILWEGTSNGVIITRKKFAPPIYEVSSIAQEKILSSVPSLN